MKKTKIEKTEYLRKKLVKQERMYREYIIPEKLTDEYEKKLKIIATKGGIRLIR